MVAYIMTVTDFGWEDALRTVRAGRSCANPNLGFQRQLQEFEERQVRQVSALGGWERTSVLPRPPRLVEAGKAPRGRLVQGHPFSPSAVSLAPRPPAAAVIPFSHRPQAPW